MRNEVFVDGVRLTRAQVEKAQAELNKPVLKGGDKVWAKDPYDASGKSDNVYVILDTNGQQMAREGFFRQFGRWPADDYLFAAEVRSGRLTLGHASFFEGLPKIS